MKTFEHWRKVVLDRFGLRLSLDVAATKQNAKCGAFYTIADNALTKDWKVDADDAARRESPDAERGAAWMNNPYSLNDKFVEKALAESRRGLLVVGLLPSRTDRPWFHAILNEQDRCELHFCKGRLRFGDATSDAPFPSVVVVFKPPRVAT